MKSIESISFNASHTLSVFYTNSGKIFVTDNITRSIICKLDFGELLHASANIHKRLVSNLSELIEKDRSKLLDAVEFCKDNNYLIIASLKLFNIFLVRINYDPLGRVEENRAEVVLIKELLLENSKNKMVRLSPDPFSKYNLCLSGYNPCVVNLKDGKSWPLRQHLTKGRDSQQLPTQQIEAELEINENSNNTASNRELENSDEPSNFVYTYFLDRYCTKEHKEVIVVQKDLLLVIKFRYNKTTHEFYDFQEGARYAIPITFQLHNMQLSQSNRFLVLKHQKKSLKVFEYSDDTIKSVRDFEVLLSSC